ncbi:unnamed protein product [Ophioblennius macclurei]
MTSRNAAALVLFIAFGTVFQPSCGTQVSVMKDDKLCLFANLMLNFSVSYEVTGNKSKTVAFELPENVTTDGSSCDVAKSTLKLDFGDGHSLSTDFTVSGDSYRAEVLTFSYNLNDSTVFVDSTSEETVTMKFPLDMIHVTMDTCYSCNSEEAIVMESVNITMQNVLIQAFVNNGSKSENITSCAADVPSPSPPTPPPTPSPTTNATTVEPVTNVTSAAPTTTPTTTATTTPTPTLPVPTTGNYSLKAANQTCLLANFGLRIGYKQGGKYQEQNFEPTDATMSGSCGVNSSELVLVSKQMTLIFTFASDTKKFRLHSLNVSITDSAGSVITESNATLSLWEATLGSSYLCNKEQNFTISEELSLFTFDVQVQPFEVKKGLFSTAHDCSLDDSSILVPIIVGAALAGLILIVVIAYVIGRRKTYVGYQTL